MHFDNKTKCICDEYQIHDLANLWGILVKPVGKPDQADQSALYDNKCCDWNNEWLWVAWTQNTLDWSVNEKIYMYVVGVDFYHYWVYIACTLLLMFTKTVKLSFIVMNVYQFLWTLATVLKDNIWIHCFFKDYLSQLFVRIIELWAVKLSVQNFKGQPRQDPDFSNNYITSTVDFRPVYNGPKCEGCLGNKIYFTTVDFLKFLFFSNENSVIKSLEHTILVSLQTMKTYIRLLLLRNSLILACTVFQGLFVWEIVHIILGHVLLLVIVCHAIFSTN